MVFHFRLIANCLIDFLLQRTYIYYIRRPYKRIHLNLVLVKLLELHHLGYDLRHYHAQHHAFIKQFNLPAHFQFDVAAG